MITDLGIEATARTSAHSRARHRVVALIYEGLHLFEFSCAYEIFGGDRLQLGDGWYDFRICSVDGPLQSQAGLLFQGNSHLDLLADADTILVPGWPVERELPAAVRSALVAAGRRGARLASICSGA